MNLWMTSIRFDDLVQLQTAWLRTYENTARQPAHLGTTTARRQLIQLSCAITTHPFWATPGRSTVAHADLRREARARQWARAA